MILVVNYTYTVSLGKLVSRYINQLGLLENLEISGNEL